MTTASVFVYKDFHRFCCVIFDSSFAVFSFCVIVKNGAVASLHVCSFPLRVLDLVHKPGDSFSASKFSI